MGPRNRPATGGVMQCTGLDYRGREAAALHAGPTSYSVKFSADSSAPGSVALASIRDP